MYAAYEFYRDTYGGTAISPEEWPTICRKASAYIDLITYNRIADAFEAPQAVKLAVCAAAEAYHTECSTAISHIVKSYNNDGYSETLYTPEEAAEFYAKERAREVDLYLPRSHPLRYAGAD